jgi:glycosyltransferase involved in cell wall biosynthesis
MRVLLVHNHYQSASPSGEDIAFTIEKQLLERAGHEVFTYTRHNDEIESTLPSRLNAAVSLFWSRTTYRDLTRLIKDKRPEIAHFHNTFPLISASGYRACQDNLVPVVQTLHNYRLICPGALLMRNGKPCEDCVGHSMLPAVQHACYRSSTTGTALVTGMLAANRLRNIYHTDIDRFICLTEFARQRFIRGGLPETRLVVKPNALLDPPAKGSGNGNYALYVGRLSNEKGVETLIRAWQGISFPLKVVGDGPLRSVLEQRCRELHLDVEFLGLQPRTEVMAIMQLATFLIIPSECYEGFPITALEAFATGAPLVVSAIGALDEIIEAPQNGLKFRAGDDNSLRETVRSVLHDPTALTSMRSSNRTLFEQRYSVERSTAALNTIYESILAERLDSGASHGLAKQPQYS